jgi:hypothetical protein
VALAREVMAYADLEGALATEHYLYLSGRYSGEHTPVFMIRKIQEMCRKNICSLKAQLAAPQARGLNGQTNIVPQSSDHMLTKSGYLIFKAPCACFSVHTNVALEVIDGHSSWRDPTKQQ